MPLQKHCQLTSDEPHSALFSCSAQQGISQFLFLGFLSLSPCHCGGSCQYPTQPTSLVQSICFLHACVLLKAISQTSVYKHADLHSCKRRLNLHMCSYLRFETSRWRLRAQVEENWNEVRNNEQNNKSPRLQVETIPDWRPICFHFRVWL